jgi:ribonuclease-3
MDLRERGDRERLDHLQEGLGYRFRDGNLLAQALTHTSYAHEHLRGPVGDNERLEFLGDAILNGVMTHLLTERFSDRAEGELTRMRALLVNQRALARVARALGLGQFLLLGKGEEQTGGQGKSSILANAYEAVVGAVYLDGGYERVFHMVQSHFSETLKRIGEQISRQDFKNLLQERVQIRYHTVPHYAVVRESGPDHQKWFHVCVSVRGRILGRGEGTTRKEAEQRAAEEALGKAMEESP